jgi:formylmethanofuran dehydrogenase subunit E
MSGEQVSRHSRAGTAQMRPTTCQRCGRRVADGKGKRVNGELLCPKCAERAERAATL